MVLSALRCGADANISGDYLCLGSLVSNFVQQPLIFSLLSLAGLALSTYLVSHSGACLTQLPALRNQRSLRLWHHSAASAGSLLSALSSFCNLLSIRAPQQLLWSLLYLHSAASYPPCTQQLLCSLLCLHSEASVTSSLSALSSLCDHFSICAQQPL